MTIPFVQATNYTPGPRTRGPIKLLVVHDMEALEGPDTAESCAAYFARQPKGPPGGSSAHYCIDDNSVCQSVRDDDIAWAAPGANAQGLHFELAGYANQSRDEWLDDYGWRLLERAAALFAEKAAEFRIPVVWLEPEDVAAGLPGVTSHRNITIAFGTVGGHTDPGPNFPVDVFMGLVQRKPRPTGPVIEEDEVARRWGFAPSWSTPNQFGQKAFVEVDELEGQLHGYGGCTFEPRDLVDGDPGSLTTVDLARVMQGRPIRFTVQEGDCVRVVAQGGSQYVFQAVAP